MSAELSSLNPPPQPIAREVEVIGLVGYAHGTSHFFHLLLPPLFPWLMPEFGLSFTQAGLLMTVFFVVSGSGQAVGGFAVDRFGALRVLQGGMLCFILAALLLAVATGPAGLVAAAALAGLGNSIFHPADFTLLNRRVSPHMLGHAFSTHGLMGYLGWAAAPLFHTFLAGHFGWRVSAAAAAIPAGLALLALTLRRAQLHEGQLTDTATHAAAAPAVSTFAFMREPTVWLCFVFFLFITTAFGALQNYGQAVFHALYGLPLTAAAGALSGYLAAGAGGTLLGGFLSSRESGDRQQHERQIAWVLTFAALLALVLASGKVGAGWVIPLAVGIGFCVGIAGPSRDLMVRHAATSRFGQAAYGRVYGFVYSGLDIGLAAAPLLLGPLMDAGRFSAVLVAVAMLQGVAILTALSVGRQVESA
ncbi:MAG: MFS transporter [Burkholderiaceae bacterium]|nr:MAG: MFS transporter [Burkholderiaceae bacterium]